MFVMKQTTTQIGGLIQTFVRFRKGWE